MKGAELHLILRQSARESLHCSGPAVATTPCATGHAPCGAGQCMGCKAAQEKWEKFHFLAIEKMEHDIYIYVHIYVEYIHVYTVIQ